jgi:hypothetical protein
MKIFYIAVQICENEKYYAYIVKATESDNLLSKLSIQNVITANICPTKKRAAEIVEFWRECYKRNGNYMFSETF